MVLVDDGEPKLLGGCAFRLAGRAVAALGARPLGRGGDGRFQFGVDANAHDAPALGLDARPLVQCGAVHGRVMGQLGGLHDAAPRLLLGDVAGVFAEFGCREHSKGIAFRPGRLVFLDEPDADHVVHRAARGVRVGVKMPLGEVCVGHGSIEPHVGDRALACVQ